MKTNRWMTGLTRLTTVTLATAAIATAATGCSTASEAGSEGVAADEAAVRSTGFLDFKLPTYTRAMSAGTIDKPLEILIERDLVDGKIKIQSMRLFKNPDDPNKQSTESMFETFDPPGKDGSAKFIEAYNCLYDVERAQEYVDETSNPAARAMAEARLRSITTECKPSMMDLYYIFKRTKKANLKQITENGKAPHIAFVDKQGIHWIPAEETMIRYFKEVIDLNRSSDGVEVEINGNFSLQGRLTRGEPSNISYVDIYDFNFTQRVNLPAHDIRYDNHRQ